jgi:peroxiredoxin
MKKCYMIVGVIVGLLAGHATGQEIKPLVAGDKLPSNLQLQTAKGETFDLSQEVSAKPAVLIFYRGGWCPYCTRHLAALQEVESKIVEAGYQILAISPDRPKKLAETLGAHKLKYQLLSDSDMQAAKEFGLAFEVDEKTREKYKGYGIDLVDASGKDHYLLPVPAVYVVNQSGAITYAFAEEDYKVRLEPAKLLEELTPKDKDHKKPETSSCCAGCS